MNFNYILSTGDSSITGSSYSLFNSNQNAFEQNDYSSNRYFMLDGDGNVKDNLFYFDSEIIQGGFTSLLFLNSQALAEGGFEITTGRNKYYYNITGSGNYALDLENSENKIIFDADVPTSNSSIIHYSKRDFSEPFIQEKTGVSVGSWDDSLSDLLISIDAVDETSVSEFEEKYLLFFNGQKMVDFYQNSDLDSTTGALFAVPKKENTNDIYGSTVDLYGSGFVEGQVDFYLNGMNQDPEDYLQLYTGISMIETGVSSSISIVTQSTDNFLVGEELNLERTDQVSVETTIEEAEPIHGIEEEEDIFEAGDTIDTTVIGAASRRFKRAKEQFVTIPSDSLISFGDGINDSDFSIAFWVKLPQNGKFFLQKGRHKKEEYALSVYTGYVEFEIYDDDTFQNRIGAKTLSGISSNIWNHIAVTYDGTEDKDGIKIYINGISYTCKKSEKGSYSFSNNLGGNLDIGAGYPDLRILQRFSDCKVADLRVYNYELTSANVSDLSDYTNATDPTPSPVLWLFRNEDSLEDHSGNDLDAVEGNPLSSSFFSTDGPFVPFSLKTDLYEWWENGESTGKRSVATIGAPQATIVGPNSLNAWTQSAVGSTTYNPSSLPNEPKTFAVIWRADTGTDLDSILGEFLTQEGQKTHFKLETYKSNDNIRVQHNHDSSYPIYRKFSNFDLNGGELNRGEWNTMVYTVYDSGQIKFWVNGEIISYSFYEQSILSSASESFIKLSENVSFAVCVVSKREWSQTDVDNFHNDGNFVKYSDF